jgi:Tfp pilus assembly protein FimV
MSNATEQQAELQAAEAQAATSRPKKLLFQQMADLHAQQRALMAHDDEPETPAESAAVKVQTKAWEDNDALLMKVCVATNSRELNKCTSASIRSWAKAAGMKKLSQLRKPALVRRVAVFRSFPDVEELVSAFMISLTKIPRCPRNARRSGSIN